MYISHNRIIFLFLGNLADLIFVFFDPIGQALRKRTLNIVDALTAKHGDKIKLFLSKADEAGNETDRQVCIFVLLKFYKNGKCGFKCSYKIIIFINQWFSVCLTAMHNTNCSVFSPNIYLP